MRCAAWLPRCTQAGPPNAIVKKTSKRTAASRKRSPRRRDPEPLRHALVAFAELAERARLRWYVFGAQAVSLHGYPRATADLDLTIELGDRDPAAFVHTLQRAGFEPRFADPDFVRTTRVIPVVHRASGLPVDLVLAGPGLEQLFLDAVDVHRVGARDIPVISLEHLIVTKLLAGRPKDLEDVRELLRLRARDLDARAIDDLLAQLEDALGQSDLRPLLGRLRAEAGR